MRRLIPRLLAGTLVVAAVVGVACTDDGGVDTDRARDEAQQTRQEVTEEAKDAWASLRTDGERLIDEIQTRNDPDAKQRLLNQCRDVLEQMRKNDAANADRVDQFCNRVRETDPNARSAWNEIKAEFEELDERFRS
jgi:hypothetical protein